MPNSHSIDLELSSSQYLQITDASQTGLDFTGDFTIEAWVKLEQLPSTAGSEFAIIGKWKYGAATARCYSFSISANTGNPIYGTFSYDGNYVNGATRFQSDADTLTNDDVGVWVHLAMVADVSEANIKIYKNGVDVTNNSVQTLATSVYDSSSADFQIGAHSNNGTPTLFFDGLIDEVRVWNDVRTPTEIANNYNIELAGTESNLVAYWKLDNNALDETSNNNDLTLYNSPSYSTSTPPTSIPTTTQQLLTLGVG